MAPIFTTFDRSAQAENLLTSYDWHFYGRAVGKPSIASAMRFHARIKGGAYRLRDDGALVVLTLRDGGRFEQRTHKPGKWGWG